MRGAGSTILGAAPFLMRFLSVAGTAAMFLVGGGILAHGIGPLHHWTEEMSHGPGVVASLGPMVVNGLVGVVAGALILAIITGVSRLRSGSKAAH
jgi:predicted DNA repair protein MutK